MIEKEVNKILYNRVIAKLIDNSKKCKKDGIERIPYFTHNKSSNKYSFIHSTCIKDKGNKGKNINKKLINTTISLKLEPPKKHLSYYGYSKVLNIKKENRHKILRKIYIKAYDKKWVPLYRKLQLLSTLNKNINPKYSSIYKKDAKWIKEKYKK